MKDSSRGFSVSARSRGFTLVELLVVIAIIAILSVVGVAVFSNIQKNARDSRRKADIQAIHNSLELLFYQVGSYTQPENICTDTSYGAMGACGGAGGTGDWDANSDLRDLITSGVITQLPKDPINDATYYYTYEPTNAGERVPGEPSGSHYTLCASLLESGGSFCLNSSN